MNHSQNLRFAGIYLPVLFLLLLPVMFHRINPNPRSVIWSDAEGYYVYLPLVFNLRNIHAVPEGCQFPRTDRGEIIVKHTCGLALFQLPFFMIARLWCRRHGIPETDVFNRHYARAVALAGFSMAFLGLFFLHRALRRWFCDYVVIWVVLATFFGTNLFHYATKEPGMSHAYSFALYAFLLWHTPRFLENPSWKNALLLGGTLGWLVLIRPTNVLALLLVVLYDVYCWNDMRRRLLFFVDHLSKMAAAAAMAFLFFVPQMVYWHEMTGSWLHYSYTGECFLYWKAPKVLAVLFDPQNGLFLYSPMVLLSVAGIGLSWQQKRYSAPAVALVFLLATYLFASWWAWWFGGAFGHRSYVEFYAWLAVPLGAVVQHIVQAKSMWVRLPGIFLLVFLIFYSVQLSFLYTFLPGPWDGPDWRWNWEKMCWIWENLFDFSWMEPR